MMAYAGALWIICQVLCDIQTNENVQRNEDLDFFSFLLQ